MRMRQTVSPHTEASIIYAMYWSMEKFMCTWIMDITIDQIDPQQYGSINGSSTVHALVELVHKWIMDITMDQIDPQQYGSIKGTSTVHALVELVHKWKYAVETPGTIVRILLVDFSKAFDRVDHHILMTKCASLGLPNFYHQMADILPVSTQTEGKDRECEIGVHHCQCRCPTRHNIWTNRLPKPY